MKPKFMALFWGILAYLCAAAAIGLFAMFFAGCSVAYPLGEAGRYGTIKVAVAYVPPVDLWQGTPVFLADK
jgi:hypothetical protein